MNAPVLPRIVAICGDPGGANAVAPVIEYLLAEGRVSVKPFAYLQAATLWAQRKLQFEALNGEIGDDGILARLSEPRANLLLTGTSVNRYELEKRFIEVARQHGIPSLSILDFWSNYARRFSDSDGKLRYLPDFVAVADTLARDEMIADGIASSHIVITGHPSLDGLAAYRDAFTAEQRATIRKGLGVAPDAWLILYASQPPTFCEQDDSTPPLWLDRLHAINTLLAALDHLAGIARKPVTLLIRPHPRENGEIYRGLTHGSIRIILSDAGISCDMALAADVVVGMSTMFLVEAHHLGRPTLSIRLGFQLPDDFPPVRLGMIPAAYREDDVVIALQTLLCAQPRSSSSHEALGNASQNVAQLIHSMLKVNSDEETGN